MAEFTELPIAAGPLVPRDIYNELLNAINNRRTLVLLDATAAFTIYNNSGDATDAMVEIDTAADEIYLIVIGGANASNITKDLTAAAQDTVAELVAVINALGKGWVALQKSGAQTAHTGNDSDTLLSMGPAHTLTAARITWFTNYPPNGVIPEKLIDDILAYRAAIDALATSFYDQGTLGIKGKTATTASADDSLSDVGVFAGYDFTGKTCKITQSTGGGTGNFTVSSNTDDKLIFTADPGDGVAVHYYIVPAVYTANTLHNEALGDTAWDAAGAPNLTPPCLPHKKLWNDMKLCLELLNIMRFLVSEGVNPFEGERLDAFEGDAVWNTARFDAFAALNDDPSGVFIPILGRYGLHRPAIPPHACRLAAVTDPEGHYDFDAPFALTVSDGWLLFSYSSPNRDYDTNFSAIIKINGVKAHDAASELIDIEAVGPWSDIFILDNADGCAFNWDGTDNDISLSFVGDITIDIGAVEWPNGAESGWDQAIEFTGSDAHLYLKLSW